MVAVDWTQPIEWNDGTPAEITNHEPRFGSYGIYVDKLPKGFTRMQGGWSHGGRTFIWVSGHSGVPNDTALYTPIYPPYEPPKVRNVSEGMAQEAMEAMVTW